MSRYFSYLNSATKVINSYKGEEPFSSFLKSYFGQHKKFGSKDRKQIGHLCYCYFRLGKAAAGFSVEERLLIALFLCSGRANELLQQLKPGWNELVEVTLNKKLQILNSHFNSMLSVADIFPWPDELNDAIEYKKFCESFLIQPDLFIRIRPAKEKQVMQKLKKAGISFEQVTENCLALSNSSKLDEVLELNKEAVVQDYNSQRVGEFLATVSRGRQTLVWDCCAASGGKSILAKDLLGPIDLTVSDIRESIIYNLKKRFAEAGIKNYKSFVADLTQGDQQLPDDFFDLIICDAPCTGSGTWSRTPEQLYFFQKEKIAEYAGLQRKIVTNVTRRLKPGGYLLYITCSVFEKENGDIVSFLEKEIFLKLIEAKLLKGYDQKADTMFASLLKKPL